MLYRVVTNIDIEQVPTKDFPTRNKKMFLDFCVGYEIESTWENMTQTAKVELPKNIIIKTQDGKIVASNRTSEGSNIGGFSDVVPLFLRGDKISIYGGYKYFNKSGKEVENFNLFFEGYISKVTSKKPFVLECEDNMWILKQIPTPVKQWGKNQTLREILESMLSGTGFTVSKLAEISVRYNIRSVTSGGESVAQFLDNNKKSGFHFDSRFRGNELRVGYPTYYFSEARERTFIFQQNIISDDLEYNRKDDVALSATVQNYIIENTGKTNKDGTAKTKKRRIEVLVTFENGKEKSYIKEKDKPLPPNVGGERRQFFYEAATNEQELIKFGFEQLKKYYYDGFRGSFTTFGLPYVRYGDYVTLVDNILPERNGKYIVRKVEYSGGNIGVRQKITLDYKII
jgi:hypothetical protein